MTANGDPPEIALSAVWQEQRVAGPLRTVDGREIQVIHRGTWTHGFGPDFQDALILFEGKELHSGSVEVHLRTRGWTEHGHARDPRYDDVILHVVLEHDGTETRRSDAALVPVLALAPYLTEPLKFDPAAADWSRFGREACAPDLARREPKALRTILWRLGDARLAQKAARLEARLTELPPGEVLYAELWDGLGFSANREPMRALAALLPLAALEAALATVASGQRLALARGLLFGAARFLPLAPADAAFARLTPTEGAAAEACWERHGGPWHEQTMAPRVWTRARVRPANHPAARLGAGAALLAGAREGLVAALLAPVREGRDLVGAVRDLTAVADHPTLGPDRAAALVANALLPFALAFAEHTGDTRLTDAASAAWETLPAAGANEVTRRTTRQVAGEARLGPLGERGQQGLIHLDAGFCTPRRCYECPVAHRVLADAAE